MTWRFPTLNRATPSEADRGLVGIRGGVEVVELREVVNRQVLATYRDSSDGRPALTAVLDATKEPARELGSVHPTAAG